MNIAIMCSLSFAKEAGEIQEKLEEAGHEVSLPFTVVKILNGEFSSEEIEEGKANQSGAVYKQHEEMIKKNYERMLESDAILVVNFKKKGIPNYIGGNTFLEVGFAYINNLKIFFWHKLPDIEFFAEELHAMSPVIINEDISLIR